MSSAQRGIHQHASLLAIVLRLTDTLAIVSGLRVATALAGITLDSHGLLAAASAIVIFSLVAEVGGLYRSWHGCSAAARVALFVAHLGHDRADAFVCGLCHRLAR